MSEEETRKLLQLFNPQDKKILDVGCGDGRYSSIFADSCKKYVGIDINEETIKLNNLNNVKNNVFYEVQNIIKYNSNEKFDIIILSLAFHEIDIKEQGLAIINMLNLLDKYGQIIILDPALENDSFQALWNVAYNCLKFYNHDYSVKHSQDVIAKAVENNLCNVIKKDSLAIPFEFNNFDEIYQMIINDEEFKDVKWNEDNKLELYNCLLNFVKKKENIIIYDKLEITILQKSEG